MSKLDSICEGLNEWTKLLAKSFKSTIAAFKRDLEDLIGKNNVNDITKYNQARVTLINLLSEEEAFWKQRSKTFLA